MREKSTHKNSSVVRHSFVAHVWREEGQTEWRYRVQHVRSGESVLLRSLDELGAFIERWTGKLSGPGRKGLK